MDAAHVPVHPGQATRIAWPPGCMPPVQKYRDGPDSAVQGNGIPRLFVPAAHGVVGVLEYEARSTTSAAELLTPSTRTLKRVPRASGKMPATSIE